MCCSHGKREGREGKREREGGSEGREKENEIIDEREGGRKTKKKMGITLIIDNLVFIPSF